MWNIFGNELDVLLYIIYLSAWAFGGFFPGVGYRRIHDRRRRRR